MVLPHDFPMLSHVFCPPVQAQGQVVWRLTTNGHHHPTRRLQLRDVHDTLVTQFFKVQAVGLVEVRGHRFLNMAPFFTGVKPMENVPIDKFMIRKASIACHVDNWIYVYIYIYIYTYRDILYI